MGFNGFQVLCSVGQYRRKSGSQRGAIAPTQNIGGVVTLSSVSSLFSARVKGVKPQIFAVNDLQARVEALH